MKSIVLSSSETGRLVTREVSLGVTTSELKSAVKEAFPALGWADLSDVCGDVTYRSIALHCVAVSVGLFNCRGGFRVVFSICIGVSVCLLVFSFEHAYGCVDVDVCVCVCVCGSVAINSSNVVSSAIDIVNIINSASTDCNHFNRNVHRVRVYIVVIPAVDDSDSNIRLSVDYVGGGGEGGEGCGSNKERVLRDEERLCDVVEEMEETRVKVKVHRMLPLCCGGCERPYDVNESGGRSDENAKEKAALNPCLLQCGHSVCAECVECARGMMKKHEEEADEVVSRHEVKRIKMVCPIAGCGRESSWLDTEEEKVEADEKDSREEVDGPGSTAFFTLPPHSAMGEYIKWQRRHVDEESMRRCHFEAAMECSECGNRASVMCETCYHRVYCDQCHPVMWKHHRLTPVSSMECPSNVDEKRRCEAHPEEECTLYCRSEGCECLVCSRCVFSAQQHFQHDVIPLDEAVASVSKRLVVAQESWLKLIDTKMRNVSRSQLSWEEMSADLEKLFDALERRLRELRQSTMEDMRRRYVNAEKSLVEESVRVGEQLGQLHVCVDQCRELMESDSVINSNLDLRYSAGALVETITHSGAILRMVPEVEPDDENHAPPITFPSVTKSVLSELLTVCLPYRLEASRVCGESIAVRFHTAFARVGPMNENVVELECRQITDDNQESDEIRTDVDTQRVSAVVHDHKFTIRGLTPNKKYRIRIVDNPGAELICRTSHLTGSEIWDRFYVSGKNIGSDNDVIEAINHYEELAEEGSDGAALASIGACYYHGIRRTVDRTKAIEFYRASAELNNDDGQFLLARCYLDGTGVGKLAGEAVRLYRLAAEQGHPIAQNNLGQCYWSGEGVVANYSEAVKWYRLSAHQGDMGGQCNLGVCYFDGKGVDEDLFEAFKWFQLSADQAYHEAHARLGECYENGYGVIRNHIKAVLYYKDAARKGSKEAKAALNRLSVALD